MNFSHTLEPCMHTNHDIPWHFAANVLDYARIMNQVRSPSHSIYALQPRSVPSHTLCKVDTVMECLSLLIHDKVALAVAVTLGACIDELLAQLSLPAFLLGLLQLELPSLLLAFLVFFSVAC